MLTLAAGVVLALAVDPLLGLIALVGVADLVIARTFATGRLGMAPGSASSGQIADELAPGDASQDPAYNPYARED